MVENYFDLLNKFKEVYPTIIMVGGLPISVRINGLKYKFSDYYNVKTDLYTLNVYTDGIRFEYKKLSLRLLYITDTKHFNILHGDNRLRLTMAGNLETGILDNIYNEEDYETDLSKWTDEFLLYAKLKGWL